MNFENGKRQGVSCPLENRSNAWKVNSIVSEYLVSPAHDSMHRRSIENLAETY